MKKNLIVSFDSYSWVENCTGLILENPKSYEIMIVCSNDTTPIYHYKDLCPQAVYEQRKDDLYNIGKELRIPKISNLLFDENNIDPLQLTIQLQLPIAVGQFTSIIYQDNKYLDPIFSKISKMMHIPIYKYDGSKADTCKYKHILDNEQLKIKKRVLSLIVGGIKEYYIPSQIEKLFIV